MKVLIFFANFVRRKDATFCPPCFSPATEKKKCRISKIVQTQRRNNVKYPKRKHNARPLFLQASSCMPYDFYTSTIFVEDTNIFMGHNNSSYRPLILPVLENSFQRTLFLASKTQITKSSAASTVRFFSKVWCLHYHMTREVIYLGYNTAVCWKINFTHVSTKIYILIHQLHQILIPNVLLKDTLIKTVNKLYMHIWKFLFVVLFF